MTPNVYFAGRSRDPKAGVAGTMGSGRQAGASDVMCPSSARDCAAEQFPTLVPPLFLGASATREMPHASTGVAWIAFVHQESEYYAHS